MKYIKICDAITVTGTTREGQPFVVPLTFAQWFHDALLIDPQFGKNVKDLMMAMDIKAKLDRSTDYIELSDSEYEKLKEVVEAPSGGYNTAIAIQVPQFIRSVMEPLDEAPIQEKAVASA